MANRQIPERIKARIRELRLTHNPKAVIDRLRREDNFKISLASVHRIWNKLKDSSQPAAGNTTSSDVGPTSRIKKPRKTGCGTGLTGYDFFCYLIDNNNRNSSSSKISVGRRRQFWQNLPDGERAMWEETAQLQTFLRREAMTEFGYQGAYDKLKSAKKKRVTALVNPQLHMPELREKVRQYQQTSLTSAEHKSDSVASRGEDDHAGTGTSDDDDGYEIGSNWSDKQRMLREFSNSGPRSNSTALLETPPRENSVDSPSTIGRVIDHAIVDGQYRFQVTWMGKADIHTSWLVPAEFSNAIIALKDYLERAQLQLTIGFKKGQLTLKDVGRPVKTADSGSNRQEETEGHASTSAQTTIKETLARSRINGRFATSSHSGISQPKQASVFQKSVASNWWKDTPKRSVAESPVALKRQKPSEVEATSSRRSSSPESDITYPTSRAFNRDHSTNTQLESNSFPFLNLLEVPRRRTVAMRNPAETRSPCLPSAARFHDETELSVSQGATSQPRSMSGTALLKNSAAKVTESTKSAGSNGIAMTNHSLTVTEGFVFEDPMALGRKTGFQLGWTPDRIVGVVPDSYPKRYFVKWEGSRVVEQVENSVLREHASGMLVSYLESQV